MITITITKAQMAGRRTPHVSFQNGVPVFPGTEQGRRMDMVAHDIERRRLKAIRRENFAWNQVKDRASWELFRDQRLNALRASLGEFPSAPANLDFHVTGELKGPGYRIKNVVLGCERIARSLSPKADPNKHPEAFYKGKRLVNLDGSKKRPPGRTRRPR